MTTTELAAAINTRHWVRIGRWIQAPLFAHSNITGRTREFNKLTLDWDYEFINFLFLDWEYRFDEGGFNDMKTFFESRIRQNPFYFREYARIVKAASDQMIEFAAPFAGRDWSGSTETELANVFGEFYRRVNIAQPVLEGYQLVGELLEEKVRAFLGDYLARTGRNLSLIDDYIRDLNIPEWKIAMTAEEEQLLEIAASVQERKVSVQAPAIQRRLAEHIKRYCWISTHHFLGNPKDHSYFHKRLNEYLAFDCRQELGRRADLARRQEERLGAVRSELAVEQTLLEYVDLARHMTSLKPFRVDAYYIAWADLWTLFEEIGKRLAMSAPDVMFLTANETVRSLRTASFDSALVDERKRGFAIVKIDGALEVISGQRLSDLQSQLDRPDYSAVSEVKGTMAYRGKVRGRAVVLHSQADMQLVKDGDIIVIAMTDPDYVPVMKKAASFVTDFGGMLCHAAVVARELGTPCVIGTDIATKVFRTGDTVEVDADEGVVRRLASAEA